MCMQKCTTFWSMNRTRDGHRKTGFKAWGLKKWDILIFDNFNKKQGLKSNSRNLSGATNCLGIQSIIALRLVSSYCHNCWHKLNTSVDSFVCLRFLHHSFMSHLVQKKNSCKKIYKYICASSLIALWQVSLLPCPPGAFQELRHPWSSAIYSRVTGRRKGGRKKRKKEEEDEALRGEEIRIWTYNLRLFPFISFLDFCP